MSKGRLFIISGPSGSGKTTLVDNVLEKLAPRIQRAITTTTRPPREGELDGEHYYFLSQAEFEQAIREEKFYEYANVFGNYYGTFRSEVREKLFEGIDVLLNIDVQGAQSLFELRERDPFLKDSLVSIFLFPESKELLEERLKKRSQDDTATIEKRLLEAEKEMEYAHDYDYTIPTSSPQKDLAHFLEIYSSISGEILL